MGDKPLSKIARIGQADVQITVVTTMRDEGPFILEWLAHLKSIGVTHVVVFSNDCTDGSDRLLDQLSVLPWITHIRQTLNEGDSAQWTALRHAWHLPEVGDADWLLFCDVDEFPEIKIGDGTFKALISDVGQVDAIALPWRLFGNAKRVHYEDKPVTTQFTRCAPPDLMFPIASTFFKTLFRKKGPFAGMGVHRPKQKNPENHGLPVWVDGSGVRLPSTFVNNPKRLSLVGTNMGRDLVELRHYSLKSVEAFLIKRGRGLPNRSSKPIDLRYWVQRNFNQSEVAPLDIPNLAWPTQVLEAHAACVSWYKARAKDLIKDRETYDLYCDLILATGSRCLAPSDGVTLYKMYQNVNGS